MFLILASKSPRRKEILTKAGFRLQIHPSNVDENVVETDPVEKVAAIARKKGLDIFQKHIRDEEAVILSADTIVVIDGEILGKPKDKDEARSMIQKIQGKTHLVYTAVFIKSFNEEDSFVEGTEVTVSSMTESEIEKYISSKEPYDKAGGYAIQGEFSQYIASINGDYYNVMGLPITRVKQILSKYDFSQMMSCPVCNNVVNAEDEFCIRCGHKLTKAIEENKTCPNCHRINSLNNDFCIYCGKDLSSDVPIAYVSNQCHICLHINPEGTEYCESCGTILNTHNILIKEKYKKDYGKISMILGIVSAGLGIQLYGGFGASFILSIISIILGIISIKRGYKGKSLIGIITSIIGIVISIFMLSIFFQIINS